MIGPERTSASIQAQLFGRGLSELPTAERTSPKKFLKWTPSFFGDKGASAGTWSAFAAEDSNAGARSCGNHVCRSLVCHKGRLGKLGLCRLGFWSWQERVNAKGERVMKRVHGKELQPRWDGCGLPPVHDKPPMKGMPKLERTQPFHFKMNPGIMLGPRCNHDLGVICKLPVLKSVGGAEKTKEVPDSTTYYLPLTTYYFTTLLRTTYYLLLTNYYLLLTTY